MIIYILEAHQGSYEDKCQWNVKAFATKEKAEEHKAYLESIQAKKIADAEKYISDNENHECGFDDSDWCDTCHMIDVCTYDIIDSDERVWYRVSELELDDEN